MTEALLVAANLLFDDGCARATTVCWAVGAYPALEVRPVGVDSVMGRVGAPFVTDEQVVTRLLCEQAAAPAAAIERSIVARLVAERCYGSRLFAAVFGEPSRSWRGEGALGEVTRRDYELPVSVPIYVLSNRSRPDLMTCLVATGWADRITGVVSGDDITHTSSAAADLLEAGLRRIGQGEGADVSVGLRSDCPELMDGAAALGIGTR